MRLKELAEQYRKSAEEVLASPESYEHRMLWQASILLQRNLEKALTTLARRNDGCISCIHSKPSERDPLNLTARECELGRVRNDGKCELWKPILSEADRKLEDWTEKNKKSSHLSSPN